MKKYIQSLTISMLTIMAMMAMTGCTSLPIDTTNKKIAAFETSYIEVKKVLLKWIKEKIIVGDEKADVKNKVAEIEKIKDAMYIALSANEIATANSKLGAAKLMLGVLRDIVNKRDKERRP